MKKIYSFLFAAVAMFAVASCSEEIAPEVAPEQNPQEEVVTPSETIKVEFTATRDVETKTTLTDDQTEWETSESIAINGVKFTNTAEATATFSAEVDPEAFKAPYIAVYPYSADYDYDYENTTVSNVTVAAEQTVVAGNFSSQKPVEIAYQTEAGTLEFKNVCSILQFQVPEFDETITSVTITSDKPIAGTGVVSYNDGVPTVTGAEEYTVTLTGPFETGKTYYATVLPVEDAKLTVRINGYLSKETTTAVDILRSYTMTMATLPAPVKSNWKIAGISSWNYASSTDYMYIEYNMAVRKNVTINTGFKLFTSTNWMGIGNIQAKTVYTNTYNGDGNMSIAEGSYDVYISKDMKIHESNYLGFFFVVPAGTDISNVQFNNKFGLIGNGDWNNDIDLTFNPKGYFLLSNVTMTGEEFKIRQDRDWAHSWGTGGNVTKDTKSTIYHNGANSTCAAGTYDLYTDFVSIWLMTQGQQPQL